MIIAKLMGGLGNQMFQYALGRNLAKLNNTQLKLDRSFLDSGKGCTPRQYCLSTFKLKPLFATSWDLISIKTLNNFGLLRIFGQGYVSDRQNGFDRNIFNIHGNCYLDGYWQSEQYFKDNKDVIKQDFQFKKLLSFSAQKIAAIIKKTKSIAIHVRRGDYVSLPRVTAIHGLCPVEYYVKAINFLTQKFKSSFSFFIFSDDINWTKKNIVNISTRSIFVSEFKLPDYEELNLMTLCNHVVTANSSFSWWGAWLNNNKNKIVIAPKKWFSDPKKATDIVPNSWIRL